MKKDGYKTFNYPIEYNEDECEDFIKHFINLAIHISIDCLKKSKKYFGLDLAKTAAYEGCFKAYILTCSIDNPTYLHKKGLVRMCVKRSFWSFAVIFGFIRSSGQIYFPSEFVNYEYFFKDRSASNNSFDKIDLEIINNFIKDFPLKEREIHQLFLSGYDYAEIGRKLGYKNKSSPLKLHKRSLDRLKKIIKEAA